MRRTVQCIEDNAGGLHMAVFEDGECSLYHERERAEPGSMHDMVKQAAAYEGWILTADASEDSDAEYEELTAEAFGWYIVAEWCDGVYTEYPEDMGAAARLWAGAK